MVGNALGEATGRQAGKRKKNDVSDRDVVVLGSGNLGLVYLMEERRRLTLEEMNERHPDLIPALRNHPHVGWLLVRSSEHGPVVLGGAGTRYLADGRVEGEDPLAPFSANAPKHLLRRDGFAHVADIMIGSFYEPALDKRLRVRGADLVPRRHRRPADAAVHPPPAELAAPDTRDHRRRRGPRDPARLEARAQRHRRAGGDDQAQACDPRRALTSSSYATGRAAASPLVLTATFVVIRSTRPRTTASRSSADSSSGQHRMRLGLIVGQTVVERLESHDASKRA